MAVTIEYSAQIAGLLATPKVFAKSTDFHGKFRLQRFDFTQGAAAGDAGSQAVLADLPKGRIRLLGLASVLAHSALGAARTLDFGWDAYDDVEGNAVVADPNGLISALDVSGAGILADAGWDGAGLTADKTREFVSKAGVVLRATINGGTIPAAATLNGYLAFVCE